MTERDFLNVTANAAAGAGEREYRRHRRQSP
jgi:hypothetical protein